MATVEQVEQVVPAPGTLRLSPREREAILEVAYLAIAADRKLNDEELEAFRAVASRLREIAPHDPNAPPPSREEHRTMSDRELNAILNRFADGLERSAADERLRAISKELQRPEVRHLAYKVAYALALCDLETSDEEFEFDLQLIDSLELTREEADTLADEVMAVFNLGA
ncbi:MAG: hypothetical protein JWM74_234 [Myxococcaceae bacterium]|jgi:hypothetical protein|nr:hypothetical protein [Myxococcaceae bacterium]